MTVYDTFLFFNELDLLEIRLHVLDGVVDRFVLVEATRDHAGRAKPLHFAESRDRFAPFLDRIVHVVVDDMPPGPDRWRRENHQRRAILRGLGGCGPRDRVLVSDVDEIPRPEALEAELGRSGLSVFMQRYHAYFLNFSAGDDARWPGTALVRRDQLGDPQRVRRYRSREPSWLLRHLPPYLARVPDGGWHFTYLGGVDSIILKMESFAHGELDTAERKSSARIASRIEQGLDLFLDGDEALRFRRTELDESYPRYLREHAERYPHLLHPTGPAEGAWGAAPRRGS